MLITFRSKAWSSIIMNRDIAVTLLKIMGHSGTVPSALLAADIPEALARLERGLDVADPSKSVGRTPADSDDQDEPPPVGLRLRAYPLIQMLKAAAGKNTDVTWEEGAGVV